MSDMEIKDSGQRQNFETGAVRDTAAGKYRPELISPFLFARCGRWLLRQGARMMLSAFFIERLGHWLERGAAKYSARNWEKGIPMDRTMASLLRHLNDYRAGDRSEDHLAAAACNVMFLIHTEEMVKRGRLPTALNDIPDYGG